MPGYDRRCPVAPLHVYIRSFRHLDIWTCWQVGMWTCAQVLDDSCVSRTAPWGWKAGAPPWPSWPWCEVLCLQSVESVWQVGGWHCSGLGGPHTAAWFHTGGLAVQAGGDSLSFRLSLSLSPSPTLSLHLSLSPFLSPSLIAAAPVPCPDHCVPRAWGGWVSPPPGQCALGLWQQDEWVTHTPVFYWPSSTVVSSWPDLWKSHKFTNWFGCHIYSLMLTKL